MTKSLNFLYILMSLHTSDIKWIKHVSDILVILDI